MLKKFNWIFSSAKPLWPSFKGKGNQSELYIYIWHAKVYRHARFDCQSINIIRSITIKLHIKNLSSLRCNCDLEWRLRASDWQRLKSFWNNNYFHDWNPIKTKICWCANLYSVLFHQREFEIKLVKCAIFSGVRHLKIFRDVYSIPTAMTVGTACAASIWHTFHFLIHIKNHVNLGNDERSSGRMVRQKC